MAQQGQLFSRHGAWYVRYRANGKREAHRLASVEDYPLKSEVRELAEDHMRKINRTKDIPEAGATVGEFVDNTYFPDITKRLAESTTSGYKKCWNAHLKKYLAHRRVRDFRPCDIQQVLDRIEQERGQSLSHCTYQWIKVSLSAIFAHAVRSGLRENNPVYSGSKQKVILTPKGRRHGRKTFAYSLDEIRKHLAVFAGQRVIRIKLEDGEIYQPEISRAMVRCLIGVAAFAGLRQGEIRGLWADDDRGDVLHIRRTVWGTSLKECTKTGEDAEEPGMIPVIEPLRVLLDAVKPEHGFIFTGSRGAAIDLENLADRVMKPALSAAGLNWHGWHAYRRGLASNLKQMGMDDMTIQAILRHQDVNTTRRFYIKVMPQQVTDAMQQLGNRWATAAVAEVN